MERVLEYTGSADIYICADSAYGTRPSDRHLAEVAGSLTHMSGKGAVMRKPNPKEIASVVGLVKK